MMGGIPTNIHGQALAPDGKGNDKIIDGLYAVGEVACVSVHGANRLGGNSLLDLIVFGRSAGLHIIDALNQGVDSREASSSDLDEALQRLNRWDESTEGESVADLRKELQSCMQLNFGVFRKEEPMLKGIEKLTELRQRISKAVLNDKSKAFNTAKFEALWKLQKQPPLLQKPEKKVAVPMPGTTIRKEMMSIGYVTQFMIPRQNN